MAVKNKEKASVSADYAIFQTGGKQYQAVVGKTLAVEKLDTEEGKEVTFSDVLLKKAGDKVEVGTPFIKTAITAVVLKQAKAPKIIVFKFKRRKKHMRKQGHRQPYTLLRIQSI